MTEEYLVEYIEMPTGKKLKDYGQPMPHEFTRKMRNTLEEKALEGYRFKELLPLLGAGSTYAVQLIFVKTITDDV